VDVVFPEGENVCLVIVVVGEGLDDDPSVVAGGEYGFLAGFLSRQPCQQDGVAGASQPNLVAGLIFPIAVVVQERQYGVWFVEDGVCGFPPVD